MSEQEHKQHSENRTLQERVYRWLNPEGLAPYGRWMESGFGGSFWVQVDWDNLPAKIAAVLEFERTHPITVEMITQSVSNYHSEVAEATDV